MTSQRNIINRKAEDMTEKTHRLTKIALMTSILCIMGPLAITFPFSPVPVSLTTLVLYVSVYVIGKRDALVSCAMYLLIGLIGIPVFSGFTGGIGKVLGPTGGYLVGYLFLTYISGWFVENIKSEQIRKNHNILCTVQVLGMAFATAVCYFLGSIWLSYQTGVKPAAVLMMSVIPFIPGDVIKILSGAFIGRKIKKCLKNASVL